jgi:hypothetical protein
MNSDIDLMDTVMETDDNGFPGILNPYRPYDFSSAGWLDHEQVIEGIKRQFASQPENRIAIVQGKPCSGKTTILKQIHDTPELLGPNCIPIYLDFSQYINLGADDLLFSISKKIIDQLNKSGYPIPLPDEIKNRQIDNTTMASLILLFDSFFEGKEVLLLLFDEFDRMLEHLDPKIISQYIRISDDIVRSWSNYGLIIAGDKPLLNLSKCGVINRFFEHTPRFNIENTREEKIVADFITKPIEEQLTYDHDAIKRIIWYSGKNLYFQQLICYTIVNHLNKKIRGLMTAENIEEALEKNVVNRCSLQDVETAVQQVLNEPAPNFSYVWEKKLTSKERLVVSALADKNITQKQDSHYVLKENSLLDNILGDELHKEIEKLQEFGYILKMKRRHFDDFPFTVPLFGKWLEKAHPFTKTVIEQIETTAGKIDLSVLVETIKETPPDQMAPFEKEAILEIAEKWLALTHKIIKQKNIANHRQMTKFIEGLSLRLNLPVKQKPQANENHFILDVSNLNIGTLDQALCFVQNKPELKSDDIFNIENKAVAFEKEAQNKLTLLFHFHKEVMVETLAKKPYLSLISITGIDLKKIILAETPVERFRKIILNQLSLNKISPYETAGPTTAVFYGRIAAINRIVSAPHKSFAIVGSRKIGKTSLLLKIKDNKPPGAIYIPINLESIFSDAKNSQTKPRGKKQKSLHRLLFKAFLPEIERSFHKKLLIGKLPFMDISRLPKIVEKLSQKGEKIIFVIDEIDDLIKFEQENNYQVLRLFRSMSQASLCQFVFAGYKELYHFKRDFNHPLYNFCEEIKLQPLEKEAGLDLITKPMAAIGVSHQNKGDRDIILEYTGSHPNLLQFYCQKLVEKVDKHENLEDRRTIFFKDIQQVSKTNFEEHLLDEFYMFSSDLSKIDRLILILMAENQANEKGKVFSLNDIRQLLLSHEISLTKDELHKVLKNLVIRFILTDEGSDNYKFALKVFPGILAKRTNDEYKKDLIEEMKANAS